MTEIFENLGLSSNLVYVRPIEKSELPDDVQSSLETVSQVYSVHGENGEQVALFTDLDLVFSLAKEYNFRAMSVH